MDHHRHPDMTPVVATPALGSFSAVDTDPAAAALIAALDEQASIPAIQRLRAAATEMLDARLGHHLLDIGCGSGDVARALAGRVGPPGTVLGIDASATMLTEARRRTGTSTLPVEFRPGNITNLELDDGTFDGTLCERVFQHLASPDTAMAELVRVTRPGGRIVVIDTDWGMHAIHGADPTLTAAVVDSWARNAANGLAGRRLTSLFADAGLRDPIVRAETMTSTDPQQPSAPPFTAMAATAGRAGTISAADADTWLDQLAAAGRRGHFFWAVTMFAVAGRRS
jgi:ubiquinone/menaquinone biosynthesis C-methylase UbiE